MCSSLACGPPLERREFWELRRRAILECCKWDPQVEDVGTLARYPILIDDEDWRRLCHDAEALFSETLLLEAALLQRPDLHGLLGLPRRVRSVLASAPVARASDVRVMRFDFHPTPDGWRVSEVNSDVPGGFIEAAGVAALMAPHYPGTTGAGDPAGALADAAQRACGTSAAVALLHATAYVDDRATVEYLGRRLVQRDFSVHAVSPGHLDWCGGCAFLRGQDRRAPLQFVFRHYPAEWLPSLPSGDGWRNLFAGSRTPLCNPATALLTQCKRWPLLIDQLGLDLPAWRRLMPESRPVNAVPQREAGDWVLKPALGRVGEGVGIEGVTPPRVLSRIARAARWFGRRWVAQRRFNAAQLETPDGPGFTCIGVFVIDGRAAGAYGRVAARPLVDAMARDAAVLVRPAEKP